MKWVASRFTAQSFSPMDALRTLHGAEAPGLFSSPWLSLRLPGGEMRASLLLRTPSDAGCGGTLRPRAAHPTKHPLSTSSIDSPAIFILCLSAFIHRIKLVVFCRNSYKNKGLKYKERRIKYAHFELMIAMRELSTLRDHLMDVSRVITEVITDKDVHEHTRQKPQGEFRRKRNTQIGLCDVAERCLKHYRSVCLKREV